MTVKILFNSASVRQDLSTGWGVSFLIGDTVLFDTGEKGEALTDNMRRMNVDIKKIKDIVISHDHWDHTGGLWDILQQRQSIRVYGCPGFGDEFKKKVRSRGNSLIEGSHPKEISQNIYVTGEMTGEYKGKNISEQALVVDDKKGLTVITGCAHPGIIQMLDVVRQEFPGRPLYAVFGGFHLIGKHPRSIRSIIEKFRNLGIKKAGPTHCSGTEAENAFKQEYGDDVLSVKVGEGIHI